MLESQDRDTPTDSWMETLIPKLKELQQALKLKDVLGISKNSGCTLVDNYFHVPLFDQEYKVSAESFAVSSRSSPSPTPYVQALILEYLNRSDGTMPTGEWINFRELPSGGNYNQAFNGYASMVPAEIWKLDIDGFAQACLSRGGVETGMGDAGFMFRVLPRIHLCLVYWLGDEEFPSSSGVLFDSVASHHMVTDGLAILGKQLVTYVVENIAPE